MAKMNTCEARNLAYLGLWQKWQKFAGNFQAVDLFKQQTCFPPINLLKQESSVY